MKKRTKNKEKNYQKKPQKTTKKHRVGAMGKGKRTMGRRRDCRGQDTILAIYVFVSDR